MAKHNYVRRVYDVDIDVNKDCDKDQYGTRAMLYNQESETITSHPSGYYLESVPVDPETGCCAFDYEYGDEKGFHKIDLLTNSSYNGFSSKQEVINALTSEPPWSKLGDPEFVAKLPHIAKHFDVVSKVQPRSIEELADVLALIRPGKKHLLDAYLKNPKSVRRNLYKRSTNEQMYFKKSHSISYAAMIVCVMNKLSNRTAFVW